MSTDLTIQTFLPPVGYMPRSRAAVRISLGRPKPGDATFSARFRGAWALLQSSEFQTGTPRIDYSLTSSTGPGTPVDTNAVVGHRIGQLRWQVENCPAT
jgi:hypothetical protein